MHKFITLVFYSDDKKREAEKVTSCKKCIWIKILKQNVIEKTLFMYSTILLVLLHYL